MTVLLAQTRRLGFFAKCLHLYPEIYIYKGTFPANCNMTLNTFKSTYASDLLCTHTSNSTTGMALGYEVGNIGWRLSRSPAAVNASGTGTASWFVFVQGAYPGYYDYWISDSISTPGGSGMLQLTSLAYTAGSSAPTVTDFSLIP